MRAIASSVALALLYPACAAGPRPAATAQKSRAAEPAVPPECATAVPRAARLGQELFVEDKMAEWATDALFAEGILPADKRVRGWVCTRAPGPLTTHFLGGDEGQPDLVLYRVEFGTGERNADGTIPLSRKAARVVRVDPPELPSDRIARMFAARQAAVREPFRQCSDRYNSVVLSPESTGESGWLVYLLAATTKREAVFGGHLRRLVSLDGRTVLKDEPLSLNCNSMPLPEAAEALVVTSLVSPCPLETHVFLSLLHGRRVFVGNSSGTWGISGREIRYYGPHAKEAEPEPSAR